MAAEDGLRPRLLYLITSFNGGGAEWGLVNLVRHGAFQGFELSIAALVRGTGAQVRALEDLGHPPQVLAEASRPTPSALLQAAWRLAGLLRRLEPEVLVLSLPHANLLGRLLAPRRARVVSFEHNSRLARGVYETGYRLTSHRVDWMLADCAATAEAAERRLYRRPPARRTVLPLVAFPPERLEAPARRPDQGQPFRLLSAGRLTAAKNHAHLVAVVAELRRRGLQVELTLCGEGPLRDALAAQAAERGAILTLPGHLADWWRTPADLFVLASRHEGLCIVALEAMAAGLPVAAPAVGGLRDYGPSAQALVLDGADVEADAERLAALLQDHARLDHMARLGRRTAGESYSVSAVQACYKAFSTALISSATPRKPK
jgi:glycosyltransferase involved in cell wall biosynthesis